MAKGYLYDNGDELISREDTLPSTSSASSGDVLSLNEDKEPVWSAPSGGSNEVIEATYTNNTVYFTEPGSNTHLTMTEVFEKLENGAFLDGSAGLSKFTKREYQGTEFMSGYCIFLLSSLNQCLWTSMAIIKSNDTTLDVTDEDQFSWEITTPQE